jgi:hypothetical protein
MDEAFEPSSPSESSSDDDDSDHESPRNRVVRKATTEALKTPAPAPARSPAVTASPGTATRKDAQVPDWLTKALAELRSRYPRDEVACVPKQRPEGGPPDWRMKCLDW